MAGSFWVSGALVQGVVVVNSGIPMTSGESLSPWQNGYLYPTVYVVNPSG